MRFLILLVVLFWCIALLRRALSWMMRGLFTVPQRPTGGAVGQTQDPRAVSSRRLVRDPVCGVHVAEVLAIPLHEGKEIVHFCSTACRDKYVAGEKKIAANG